MVNDTLRHAWMVSYLGNKLSKDYDRVSMNLGEGEKNEFKGHYPDLILGNHGLVLALMEVETEESVTADKVDEWKTLAGLGAKLIVMVPKTRKAKTLDLLWKGGIADRASVGSYDIIVNMP
jgi:hypothetical protein